MATIKPLKTSGYQSVGVKKSELPSAPPPVGMQYVQQRDNTYKLFAKPPAPAGTKLTAAPTTTKGVFTNKSTGKYTNAQGQEVDAQGNVIKAPVVDPTKTYAERSKGVQAGEVVSTAEYGKELGFDTLPSTMEEAIKRYKDSQAADLKYTQDQQRLAEQSEASQFEKSMRDIGASVAGTTAALAQGREGAVGSSAPQAIRQYQVEADRQTRQLQAEQQSAQMARTETLRKIQEATAANDENLVRAYQGQLSSIENDLRRLDTEAQNAATQALEMSISSEDLLLRKEANQRSNLESFTTLIDQGVELGTEGIMSFAQNLNIPFESAFSYYQGAQKVRDDKTLSLEEKQIKNQQLVQDLQDTISGQNIAEVKKLAIIENLYKSGATQEEISRAKDAFGLTDDQDPVYQAELRIKLADATMKEMAAKGEVPYGSTDWIDRQSAAYDLAGKQKDFYAQYGGTWDPEAFKIGEAVGWCGEYASTLSTAPRVGDMWSEKRTKINDKNPSIGDKLLVPLGGANGYGHVAVVLGYDPTTGDIQVAESNVDGRQNKGAGLGVATFGNYNVFELNQKFGNDWGVAHGDLKEEYAKAFNAGKGASGKIASTVKLLAKTSDKKDIEENINTLVGSGDTKGLQDYVTRIAVEDLPAADQTKMLLRTNIVGRGNELIAKMKAYEAAGGDLGIFQGTSTTVQNKIGKIDNQQAQELAQAIRLNLEDFGRAQTGAAVQDFENKKFQDILPSLFDGSELAEIKINSFAQALETDAKSTLKFKLGDEVYDQVFGGQAQAEAPQQSKMNPLLQFVIDKMDASNLDDLYSQAANLPSDTSEFDAVWGSPLTPSK